MAHLWQLAGAKTAPQGKLHLGGSEHGDWVYTERTLGPKKAIPD